MRHARVGGTEQVLDKLALRLAEDGHEVTIVCRSHGEPPHPEVRFQVLRSSVIGPAWRMWAFARDVERHVAEGGYDVTLGLGKTWSHDVIRTGGGSHQTYLERARPHERRLPGDGWLKDRVALSIERRAFAPGSYRKVIANSHMVRQDIVQRYDVPGEAIEVIYNGVDLERFRPENRERGLALRTSLGLTPDQLVLLFVGGGFGRKGLGRLIDALPSLVRAHPKAVLLVLGRDSGQRGYARRAAERGVSESIVFLGRRPDPEVCYGAADLYVLPTWYDSFAFSISEALASGLPVVTTNLAGASELVEPGVHGAVLPGACGPEELGAALLEWSRPDRREAAAPAARARAEQHGIDRSMGRIEEVLLGVARGSR
jgi:UDP-glucose:(heptosyl)LPS alpha-1,3-glucosyltransferase